MHAAPAVTPNEKPFVNAPAKRAAWLMIGIGVLLMAISFVSTMYAMLVPEWIDAQLAPHKEILADNPMLRRPVLTWVIAVFGGLGLIESGLSIALGLWILKGRRWAVATSLVLTLLRLLIVGLMALLVALAAVLERAMQTRDPAEIGPTPTPQLGVINVALPIIATLVLLTLAVWLIQAMRAKPSGPLSLLGEG